MQTTLTGDPFAGTNRIDRFQRLPSDLRKYLEYTAHIKAQYGSVMRFVVKERLCWGDGDAGDLKPKGRPFEFDGMACIFFLFIFLPRSRYISSGKETTDPRARRRGYPNLIQRLAVWGRHGHRAPGGVD